MRINQISIVFVFLLLFSCKPEKEEVVVVPPYVLPEDSLVVFLTQAYLGEGASGINVKNVLGNQYDSVYLFNPFKENNITKQRFDTSIAFYSKHPKKLKLIYEEVLDQLSKMQASGKLETTNLK